MISEIIKKQKEILGYDDDFIARAIGVNSLHLKGVLKGNLKTSERLIKLLYSILKIEEDLDLFLARFGIVSNQMLEYIRDNPEKIMLLKETTNGQPSWTNMRNLY